LLPCRTCCPCCCYDLPVTDILVVAGFPTSASIPAVAGIPTVAGIPDVASNIPVGGITTVIRLYLFPYFPTVLGVLTVVGLLLLMSLLLMEKT